MGRVRAGVDPANVVLTKFLIEIRDGPAQAHGELDLRRPAKYGFGLGDIRPPPSRIVDRQRFIDEL